MAYNFKSCSVEYLIYRNQTAFSCSVHEVPALLDAVHGQIETRKIPFALTGSSARKLKKGQANLLAGRAFLRHLFPLTASELGEAFQLHDVLTWGSLPKLFSLDQEGRRDYLRAYTQEEIFQEQLVRNLTPFRLFLEVAAQMNGRIVNMSSIARDIQADPVSVKSYFEILEDTLMGFLLPPFETSARKRVRKAPKFYFFDLGIARALRGHLNLPLLESTSSYGEAFEQWVILETHRRNELLRKDYRLSYLRTKDDAEIDLIIERPGEPKALIEIKSKLSINDHDVAPLQALCKDFNNAEAFCFSRDPIERKIGRVACLPWDAGLKELGL